MPAQMTVADLKDAISDLPDDMSVIIQSDSEGNVFRWAAGADADGVLIEDKGWSVTIYGAGWSATDADMHEDDWRAVLAQPRVLVIHPIN